MRSPTVVFLVFRPLVFWRRTSMIALLGGLLAAISTSAQDTTLVHNPGMFFPNTAGDDRWNVSVGVVTFTTPEDITEEVALHFPAFDAHVLWRMYKGLYLDGRLLAQVVQNHASLGARWATSLNDKFTIALGHDVGYWRGDLPVQGFDTKASGWTHTPSLSFGYRAKRDLLFTLKTELLITGDNSFTIEGNTRVEDTDRVSGSAYSLYMEQPFFKKHYLTLGFTVSYTNFHWATWSLFETFDRNLAYPQITVGLIL